MAAIALTAATWTACSNDDEPTTAEQPAQPRIYTVTTTLSPRNGATTRSTMTDNGDGSISAEWQVGDKIWVGYDNNNLFYQAQTTATVTAVDPTTKAATITMTLTDPKNGYIDFGYPLSLYNGGKSLETDQIGTLADINANYAVLQGSGTLTVSGSNVTLPAVTMSPVTCIWKFSFTDGTSDITSAITKLVIHFSNPNKMYTVTPSSQSTIYVAMAGGVNAKPITIYAKTATGVYRKSAASVTLVAGKSYTTTGLELSSAAAANAVAGDLGKVIGTDGNIYPKSAIATAIGTIARAMITYVGSATGESSPYNHGLALATSEANGGIKCQWSTSTSSTVHTYHPSSDSFTSESGLQYNTNQNTDDYPAFKAAISNDGIATPTNCSAWFLPTAYQWNLMITAAGGYTKLRDGFSGVGGSNMHSYLYWSSTEKAKDYSWFFNFSDGVWYNGMKDVGDRYVRSALAF